MLKSFPGQKWPMKHINYTYMPSPQKNNPGKLSYEEPRSGSFQSLFELAANRFGIGTQVKAIRVCNEARKVVAQLLPEHPTSLEVISFKNATLNLRADSSASFSAVPLFSAFRLLELCVAVFFGFGIAYALREKIISVSDAARAIAYSACIQAFVVFAQFYSQASLGLRSLGESVIPFGKTEGVARVALEGTALLRGYGTMAHANIAAAWMGLGVICLLFLFIYEGRSALSASIHAAAGLFLLFTGMVLTFSRSGWVSVACAILAFLAVLFFTFPKKDAVRAVLLCALAASAVFFPLRWAIFPRAHLSSGEPSVNLRVLYNSIGIEVMREKPFGTGMADEPRYAETRGLFEKFGIRNPLDFQPVHNLYLLIGTELGVAGLLLLLFFLGSLFRSVGGIAPELRALSIRTKITIPRCSSYTESKIYA
jgi:O-antigen ligase